MKRLTAILLALPVVVGAVVVGCRPSSGGGNATITNTTDQHRDWHVAFVRSRISYLQPDGGQVRITGRVFWPSSEPETHAVPVGYRFSFPDDHGSRNYTISAVESDGVLIEYESEFDHTSFGKRLLERDRGQFKLPWARGKPTSAPA
jgi:hypothetical protein